MNPRSLYDRLTPSWTQSTYTFIDKDDENETWLWYTSGPLTAWKPQAKELYTYSTYVSDKPKVKEETLLALL